MFSRLKIFKSLQIGLKQDYKRIEMEFNARFSTDICINQIAKRYQQDFFSRYNQTKRLLKFLKPKVVCIVCGYGREFAIRAAKDLEIPVVELQHGVINKFHLGYNIGEGQKANFCDYFFTFGSKWSEGINFPISDDRIIPIGYEYLTNATETLKDVLKQDQILFISQGTIGDRLSKFAVDLLRNKPKNIKVVYKLHPGETLRWKIAYPELKQEADKGNLRVVEGDEPTLFQLMAESKWQIGVNSTALYEGMVFNCKTYIVNFPGKEYMHELLDNDTFKLVNSSKEIDWTYEQSKLNYKIEDYFINNPSERFIKAIANILHTNKLLEQ